MAALSVPLSDVMWVVHNDTSMAGCLVVSLAEKTEVLLGVLWVDETVVMMDASKAVHSAAY